MKSVLDKSLDDPLHLKMQEVYAKYRSSEVMQKAKNERENPQERYEKIINTIEKYGFAKVELTYCYQTLIINSMNFPKWN